MDELGIRARDFTVAYLLLRVIIGVNICMHGVSRLLAGLSGFADSLVHEFQKTVLPLWSVHVFGLVLPWAEAILGLLILVGLRTRATLIAAFLLLILLTFGSALLQDWAAAGTQLIYAGIYAVLLTFEDQNLYSLDALLARSAQSRA